MKTGTLNRFAMLIALIAIMALLLSTGTAWPHAQGQQGPIPAPPGHRVPQTQGGQKPPESPDLS